MRRLYVITLTLLLFLPLLVLLSCEEADPITDVTYFEGIGLTGQAVGRAPLRLSAGALLTIPQSGTLEYDGTGIYITPINHRRFISQAADSIIVPVTVSNTIVETTVFTGVVNANELKQNRVYRLSIYGEMSTASAADTITVRAKLNGTTLVSLTSIAGVAVSVPAHGEVVFTIRTTGAAGTLSSFCHIEIEDEATHVNNSSLAVDTTAVNNLVVTFQWSAAKVGNVAILDQAFLEVLD